VHRKLLLFAALFLEAEQKPFPGRIIVFDFEVNDGADSGKSVGKGPEQSAIAQAGVRGGLNRVNKPLNFAFDECRRFPGLNRASTLAKNTPKPRK
jgi:hypothetical protein